MENPNEGAIVFQEAPVEQFRINPDRAGLTVDWGRIQETANRVQTQPREIPLHQHEVLALALWLAYCDGIAGAFKGKRK